MDSQTTVSLPEHLRSVLQPLADILPESLRLQLSPHLTHVTTEVPYSLLLGISKWARTNEGRSLLRTQNLDTNDYSMISLLAGTITSPSSNLPSHLPPDDAAAAARRTLDDRKAITAIMNALLSIAGSGYAGWWASSRAGWRDEWRVLFALLVALVVAISEAVLYLIWQSRRDVSRKRRLYHQVEKRRRKENGGTNDDGEENRSFDGLRKRKIRLADE